MKILVFSIAYEPYIGGAEVAVKEIMARLPHVEFHIVTLRFDKSLPPYEKKGNVRIHRIGFTKANPSMADLVKFPFYLNKVFFPFTAARTALSLMRTERFDCMWSIMSYMSFPALFASFFSSVPYIITLQDGDSIEHITDRRRIRPVRRLLKMAFRRAMLVHTISSFLAQFAASMGYSGPIAVVPNGVDVERFSREYPEAELEEVRHGMIHAVLPEEPPEGKPDWNALLVTSSRLVRKNGVNHLIASLEHLPEGVKLLVVGGGPDMIPLRTQVTSTAGLDDRVRFVGHVDPDDVPKYLKAADIFVRPSLSEGFGNSFIEAMVAGLPVIATPVGGIVDFVFDPVRNPDREPTGFFCEPSNPASIAEKVKVILESPELAKRVAQNAKKMAVRDYAWEKIAKRMEGEVFAHVRLHSKP